MALKKALLDRNLSLKYHYQTEIWLSNIITGRELVSPVWLWYLRAKFPSDNAFWATNSCPVISFWEPCSHLVRSFESPIIWQNTFFYLLQWLERFLIHDPLIRRGKGIFDANAFFCAYSLWDFMKWHRKLDTALGALLNMKFNFGSTSLSFSYSKSCITP